MGPSGPLVVPDFMRISDGRAAMSWWMEKDLDWIHEEKHDDKRAYGNTLGISYLWKLNAHK